MKSNMNISVITIIINGLNAQLTNKIVRLNLKKKFRYMLFMKDIFKQKYMERLKAACLKRFIRHIISTGNLIGYDNIIQYF